MSSCAHLESWTSESSCTLSFGIKLWMFATFWYALRGFVGRSRDFRTSWSSIIQCESLAYNAWGQFQRCHVGLGICEGVDEVQRLTH